MAASILASSSSNPAAVSLAGLLVLGGGWVELTQPVPGPGQEPAANCAAGCATVVGAVTKGCVIRRQTRLDRSPHIPAQAPAPVRIPCSARAVPAIANNCVGST